MKDFIREFKEQYGEDLIVINDEKFIKLLQKNLNLATNLIKSKLDKETILAALYFPIFNEIGDELFKIIDLNDEVKQLLNYMKDINNINLVNLETEAENLRNMLVAMAKDVRVVFTKLNEVLIQAQQIEYQKDSFFKIIDDVYIPIASRLGLSYIKSSLQDLCTKFFHPKEFEKLQKEVGSFNDARNEQIEVMKKELGQILHSLGIKGEIYGRVKHISSIFNKLQNKNTTLKQIYDLSAVRIIVNNKEECYAVLGAVHTKYAPIDGRFKDYIASPKENGYQSLHTSVIMQNGEPIEIQIRTYKMHEHAEYGVAAHFLYKEHKNKKQSLDDKLLWIRQLVEHAQDLSAKDLIDELKTDLYSSEIYVQTPKGKIIKLVENSTPIDFAYQIHSDIGNKCVGAKVNGKMVPLATSLNSGDVVEIITNSNSKGPSRDWLKIIKGVGTKSKINAFFKKEMKEDNIKKGKTILENIAKTKGVHLSKLLQIEELEDVLTCYSFKNEDDMFASVGYGGITGTQILNKLIGNYKLKHLENIQEIEVEEQSQKTNKQKEKTEIIVKGVNNLLLRFAHCCNPIPGDEIIGFVSRGRGVTIHKADCPNLADLEQSRLSVAHWGNATTDFPVTLKIIVRNLTKAISIITSKLNAMKINIQGLSTSTRKENNVVKLTILIGKDNSLSELIHKISSLPEVIEITRSRI